MAFGFNRGNQFNYSTIAMCLTGTALAYLAIAYIIPSFSSTESELSLGMARVLNDQIVPTVTPHLPSLMVDNYNKLFGFSSSPTPAASAYIHSKQDILVLFTKAKTGTVGDAQEFEASLEQYPNLLDAKEKGFLRNQLGLVLHARCSLLMKARKFEEALPLCYESAKFFELAVLDDPENKDFRDNAQHAEILYSHCGQSQNYNFKSTEKCSQEILQKRGLIHTFKPHEQAKIHLAMARCLYDQAMSVSESDWENRLEKLHQALKENNSASQLVNSDDLKTKNQLISNHNTIITAISDVKEQKNKLPSFRL
jgi:hypothetical protein